MKRPRLTTTLIVLGAALAMVCGAVAWLLGTTAGLRFAATRALPYLPATLEPAELEGRLAGPLSTGRIEIATPGISGAIDSMTLDWRPLALLRGTLHVLELRVQRPTFALETSQPETPGGEDDATPSLPLNVRIDRLVVREGALRRGEETLIDDLDLEFAGRASSRRLEIESLQLDSNQANIEGHARVSLTDGDPWDVDLTWRWALGETPLAGRTQATGDVAELALNQALSEPFAAQLDGVVRDLRDTPRWALDLDLDPLAASDPWPAALHGLAAELRVEGTLADSRVAGQVAAPGVWPRTIDVAARGGWSDQGAQLENLELMLGDAARLTVGGQWTPGDPSSTEFTLDGQALGWPPAAAEQAVQLPRLTVRGRGEAGQWSITGEALARRAGLPDIEIGTALTWDGETVIVKHLTADSAGDVIRGRASGQLSTDGAPVSYRATAELTMALPEYPPAELSLGLAGDADGMALEPLNIVALGGRISGAGRIAWAGAAGTNFRLSFTDLDPGSLASEWPGRLSGELSLHGLPREPGGLSVDLAALRGTLRGLPVDGTAQAMIDEAGFTLRQGRLSIGSNSLTASGHLDDDTVGLEASLEASRLSELHDAASGAVEGALRVSGPRTAADTLLELRGSELDWGEEPGAGLAVDLRLDGTYAEGGWRGRLETLAITVGEQAPWRLQAPAALGLAADRVSLEGACMDGPPGGACVELDWARDGAWASRATVTELQLESLGRWLGPGLGVAGAVQGQVAVTGEGRAFKQLAGRLDIAAGRVSQTSGGEAVDALLEWRQGVLQLDGDPAEARATLDLELASDDRVDGRLAVAWNEADPSLDGELRVAFSQLDIITEFVPDLTGLEGRADATALLTGSLSAPRATGRFEWRDGSMQIPGLGINPRDMKFVAELASNELVFNASGRSGDGEFTAEGRFQLGGDAVEGTATLVGERLLVMDLPDMQVAASPDLRFRYLPERINIGGDLVIPFARITGFSGSGAVTASPDEVIVGDGEEQANRGIIIASRIRVAVGPDVRIEASGLRGNVEGEIITVTEPETLPWGRGELRVVEGNFRAFGQQLQIETGRLIYTGGPLNNPGLDIRAIRVVQDVTAGALVRGTLDQPEISIFSDPPMPRAEALSYLTLGKGMDQLQAGEQRTLDQAASSLALSGGGLIARDLGRRLGFDEVSVSADNASDGASLVVSKHLGGGLYVSYGLGLFDAVNTLRLRYQINRRLSIEAVSGDEAEADLFYTFERD